MSAPGLPPVARRVLQVLALLVAFAAGAILFGESGAPASHGEVSAAEWTCSMHPGVRQPEPGACPICGMDLIVAQAGTTTASDTVVLSERARALMRLRTAEVRRQSDATAEVRLLGRLEPAESTRRNVTTWIGGRIDRLLVNTTGERVRRGQVIARLYSPEVYSAHQDLLTARGQVERLGESPTSSRKAADAALDASRERLRLLGVPESELESMLTATTPIRSVPIRSPFSGTVIERVATEGAYLDTGATLFRVADLGRLWVQLDAYESDLARLSVGQSVGLEVEAFPGETFDGRVAFIDPTVDAQRRTARVRVEVDNADGSLRPGMFAEAVVSTGDPTGAEPLVVPASAPLFTGRRSVVYVEVETADGFGYQPRTVRLGPRLGDLYPVVSGLSEGERVVSRGAFALDADLQIRGGPAMMTADTPAATEAVEPVTLGPAERSSLAPVLTAYLDVQRALAEDDHPSATVAAQRLVDLAGAVALSGRSEWKPLQQDFLTHAAAIARSGDIQAARGAFEPLSAAAEGLLQRFGNPLDAPVHVAFCPMAMDNTGGRWVQQGETVDNAYFGAMMRRCGEVQAAVDPGTWLSALPEAGAPLGDPHAGHEH